MRLLLINPRYPESFWSFRWAIERILAGKRALNPPLGLATLAALSPADWQISIVDENVEPVPLAAQADVVGVCGMRVQSARQRELLAHYRARGHHVVAGGSYASLCPEHYADVADTVVCGEAEYAWKEFCADFARGAPRPLYRETGSVRLADSPTPRFDLLKLERYATATIQFSRGCPFRCEFCDIIVMFGRRPRCKTLEQVGRELDALRALRVRSAFFVDDNFIGDPRAARKLLAYLADYQSRHRYRFVFGTEVSLNAARDEALLAMLRRANFAWVFVGIESPEPESLRETGKSQNLRGDVLDSVRAFYRHGIDVLAGFIVGFDNDTLPTFERQFRLVMDCGIQAAMIGLLTALPRTPLHRRLQQEGRLLPDADDGDNTRLGTNIVPLRMHYDAMIEAYRLLYARLLEDRHIAARVRAKMAHLHNPVPQAQYRLGERLAIVARLLVRGLLPGGPARICRFVASLPLASPSRVPQAIVDWIAGLAMADYARRRLAVASSAAAAAGIARKGRKSRRTGAA